MVLSFEFEVEGEDSDSLVLGSEEWRTLFRIAGNLMKHCSYLYFVLFICLTLIISCNDKAAGDTRAVDPQDVYFDYKVKAEEKDSNVTVHLQFRRGGQNGNTLILAEPARVELDGENFDADSGKLTGAYYEIQKPAKGFVGKHEILFVDRDGKEYREEFIYRPFRLKTRIPSSLKRGEIKFEFEDLEPEDYLRISLVDTSFTNRDLNEIDTVIKGRLVIPEEKLKNLVDGLVVLLIYKETSMPIKHGTKAGGRMEISYGLEREFVLSGE